MSSSQLTKSYFSEGFFPTTNQLGYDNHSLIYFQKIGIWLNHSRYCKFGKFWKFGGLWQSIFRTVYLGRCEFGGLFTKSHRHWFDQCEGGMLGGELPTNRFCGWVHPSYLRGHCPHKNPIENNQAYNPLTIRGMNHQVTSHPSPSPLLWAKALRPALAIIKQGLRRCQVVEIEVSG